MDSKRTAPTPGHNPTTKGRPSKGIPTTPRAQLARDAGRRRQLFAAMIGQRGGRCIACDAGERLHWHHLAPRVPGMRKVAAVTKLGIGARKSAARREASKCALLCRACHEHLSASEQSAARLTAEQRDADSLAVLLSLEILADSETLAEAQLAAVLLARTARGQAALWNGAIHWQWRELVLEGNTGTGVGTSLRSAAHTTDGAAYPVESTPGSVGLRIVSGERARTLRLPVSLARGAYLLLRGREDGWGPRSYTDEHGTVRLHSHPVHDDLSVLEFVGPKGLPFWLSVRRASGWADLFCGFAEVSK